MPRGRVSAIIMKGSAVALIERHRGEALYYLFPGGGVEVDESPAEALAREIHEELGLRIEVDQLVAEVTYRGSVQSYFTARVVGGVFGTGSGREIVGPTAPDDGTYTPVWMPIPQLLHTPVHPKRVAEIILTATKAGWPTTPLKFEDTGRT